MTEIKLQKATVSLFEKLNKEQARAVYSPLDGSAIVSAGAGTGKTSVLTARVAYLLTQGIPADSICCMSFTSRAARVIKGRLEGAIGNPMNGAYVGTFHGWCFKMLRKYGAEIGINSNFTVLDSSEQLQILRDHCPSTRNLNDKNLRMMRNTISRLKCESEAKDIIKHTEYSNVKYFWGEYHDFCKKCNYLDFDDLIIYGKKVAEYTPNINHMLIDEFQDINTAQISLAVKIKRDANIFVVGDDDQRIYGFRGARTSMHGAKQLTKDATSYTLFRNYRSTSPILNLANTVIDDNTYRIKKNLVANDGNVRKQISLHVHQDSEICEQFIAKSINLLLESTKTPLSEMAVIARTQQELKMVENYIVALGIPIRYKGTVPVAKQRDVVQLFSFFRLMIDTEKNMDPIAWKIALEATPGIGVKTITKVMENVLNGENSFWGICKEDNKANKLIDLLDKMKASLISDNDLTPAQQFINFVKETSFFHIKNEKSASAVTNMAENFINDINEEDDVFNIIHEFSLNARLDDMSGGNKKEIDAVNLLTAHASKGTEFDVVFILHATDGSFPYSRAMDNLEEERRLFFVAITRAKKLLILTTSNQKKINGSLHPSRASRFLKRAGEEQLIKRIF